ncbi:MAG: type II secretion system F family protein [Candidatus Nanoarchaeia archaeon]|nr:type II secretion system F family protein [Candidatus Nanoarchaeia archaeon]
MNDIKQIANKISKLADEAEQISKDKTKSTRDTESSLDRIKNDIRDQLNLIRAETRFEETKKINPLKSKQEYLDPLVEIEKIKEVGSRYRKGKEIKKEKIKIDYTIYKTSKLGIFANKLFEKYSIRLSKQYKNFFDKLSFDLIASSMNILSKTYISLILLGTMASLIFFFLFFLVILKGNIIFTFVRALFLSIILGGITFLVIYFYPSTIVNQRRRAIKNDLPFVILHMSAIAGSGAHPIAMFNLILGTEEYPGVKGEIKKVVNYVNLFGYDLTAAMRAVALTTPSRDFKELLDGMITTIETGGNLKEFLKAKSQDTMNTYKLERKKYVESLAAYSDVYTGMLIAAPLLFFTVLAIIQGVGGGSIAGVSVKTLAIIGTFVAIPLLNLGFIVFLNMSRPEK